MAGNIKNEDMLNYYFGKYVNYLIKRNYSKYTVENYGKYVDIYLSHCIDEGVDPISASTLYIQEYIDSFEDRPPTANLIKNALRSYYDYLCIVRGVIPFNPAAGAKGIKQTTEEKDYLTAEQVGTVLQCLDGEQAARNKLIVVLMAIDCLRISEVINIDVDDVNLQEKTIYIKGKGKRNRIAYLTDNMMEYLYEYIDERNKTRTNTRALFPSCDGSGRIARTTIQTFLRKAERRTGMHLNPHKFRHTGATLAYQASKDLVAVQNLLGHENIESTKRYTHVSEENRRNLVNNSPLNGVL